MHQSAFSATAWLRLLLISAWLRMRCTCRRSGRDVGDDDDDCVLVAFLNGERLQFQTRLYFCRIRRRFTSLLCISSVCLPRNVARGDCVGQQQQKQEGRQGRGTNDCPVQITLKVVQSPRWANASLDNFDKYC